jgi:isoleucyl-tRNA synthetase
MFNSVPANIRFPQLEEEILDFWKRQRIYEKSLDQRSNGPAFIFFEGPPTANGLPHPGHCLTRAIKDLFPRYRTMRGDRCERKAGWDTHGLPVEVEVCKELGIHSKEEIESYGVEPFIQKCQQSVWRYMREWEQLTERLGFWIHLEDAYVTYHQSYVESVWWSLKTLFDQGLLYQGHKIVWWWAQGGTALSAGEVGQGYREVDDPSVYTLCPLVDDEDTALLVWTTTPWTLPSNQFVAVHPALEYSIVFDTELQKKLVIASSLVETIAAKVKRSLEVVRTCQGSELIGKRYRPPFDNYYKDGADVLGTLRDGGQQHVAWRVIGADFVTVESGTGLVHQAPAFGEVDYEVFVREQDRFVEGEGPALICAVGPDGKFTEDLPEYQGRWVKEADKDLSRDLRSRGLLYLLEQYRHDYPFCWRADEDALIQYPRESWFIKTTAFKDKMLANNSRINWLPEHIRDGRFGNFLESNVDWALSRERYWGTPLPIWVCSVSGKQEAIDSYQQLLDKPGVQGTEVWQQAKKEHPDLPEDLCVHKPYIDAITYDSPFAADARMQRVPEVIDCWYDSGAMPFAQWGYPHQGVERFKSQFPADFISEALDQTRGWFYSLLAISTMLFGDEAEDESQTSDGGFPHPYRNCIVLGLMLAEWWESKDGKQRFLTGEEARAACGEQSVQKIGKMSKQLRNYRSPQEIFDVHGADALRWYLFANQAPWNSIIYSERAIKESIPEFLLRLWNVYSFFVIYANIDGFDPSQSLNDDVGQLDSATLSQADQYRPVSSRSELDQWIVSELNRTLMQVVERMDAYDNFAACSAINAFLDGLSNWYVRRSRDRFWSSEKQASDKLDAYWTLYECLLSLTQMVAPFVPFVAESLWQNLAGVFGERAVESVHLCDYPTGQADAVDEQLSRRMQLVRTISSLGRSARMSEKLKVRQPLGKVEIILADTTDQRWLEEHGALIKEELNVLHVEYTKDAEKYITYQVQPNFKRLGPRIGKQVPGLKQALAGADGGEILRELEVNEVVSVTLSDGQQVELDSEDIQVRLQAKPGWAAAQDASCVVVLATELTPELERSGLARDLVRTIQDRRKQLACNYTDHLEVGIVTESEQMQRAVNENVAYIQRETLADSFALDGIPGVEGVEHTISGDDLTLYVKVIT